MLHRPEGRRFCPSADAAWVQDVGIGNDRRPGRDCDSAASRPARASAACRLSAREGQEKSNPRAARGGAEMTLHIRQRIPGTSEHHQPERGAAAWRKQPIPPCTPLRFRGVVPTSGLGGTGLGTCRQCHQVPGFDQPSVPGWPWPTRSLRPIGGRLPESCGGDAGSCVGTAVSATRRVAPAAHKNPLNRHPVNRSISLRRLGFSGGASLVVRASRA